MKKLLSMISRLPVYSEREWTSILKLKMNFSLYNDPQSMNSILLDKALIAETRERGIYHSLMFSAESAQESIHTYGQLISSMVEISKQAATDTANLILNDPSNTKTPKEVLAKTNEQTTLTAEDYPPIFEFLIPTEMGKFEREDLRTRIQSLMDYANALEHVLADNRSENVSADLHKQIHFTLGGEAGQYLSALINALQTDDETPLNFNEIKKPIFKTQIIQLREKDASEKYLPLTNDAYNEKLEKENYIKKQLDLTISARNEAGICHQMNTQFDKYKAALRQYIIDALKRLDTGLYVEYFNTFATQDPIISLGTDASSDIFLQKAPARSVVPLNITEDEIKSLKKPQLELITPDATKQKLNNYFRSNPNLARAVLNYQIADQAQKQLNQTTADGILPIASARLSHYQSIYPQLGLSLQVIGDKIVDNAARGLLKFFKRIWAKICWKYSKNHTAELKFIKETNHLSSLTRLLHERERKNSAAKMVKETIQPTSILVKP